VDGGRGWSRTNRTEECPPRAGAPSRAARGFPRATIRPGWTRKSRGRPRSRGRILASATVVPHTWPRDVTSTARAKSAGLTSQQGANTDLALRHQGLLSRTRCLVRRSGGPAVRPTASRKQLTAGSVRATDIGHPAVRFRVRPTAIIALHTVVQTCRRQLVKVGTGGR
jgi:hypothetical protein